MNLPMLANAGLATGMFLLFALPGLFKREARGWVPVVAIIALIDVFATLLPIVFRPLDFVGGHWNWTGKIFSVAAMLTISVVLMATGRLTAREIGLTTRQAPGTGRALLTVILPYLVVLAILMATTFGNGKPPTHETLLFEGTMPGLAEELSYRGVLLALFNKMFTGRVRFLGADIGYGVVAVSIVFGLLHGMAFDSHFKLQFSVPMVTVTGLIGFLLAWLRVRTQSLALPVIVHNVTNLIFEGVPKLF